MPDRAPRRRLRPWRPWARGAAAALGLWLVVPVAVAAQGAEVCVPGDGAYIREACFIDRPEAPVYGHGVLGETPEWDALSIRWGRYARAKGAPRRQVLTKPGHVFEDIAPRIVDVDGDGRPEVVVVQSSFSAGGQLAIYGLRDGSVAEIAVTPHIGRSFRWLAPVSIADLDGDGAVELAYVDRPHLAKLLRVWRFADGGLVEVAQAPGLSNHRIGWPYILSGLRDCGTGPEMVLATGDWRRVIAARLQGGDITLQDLGPYTGRGSVEAELTCP